MRWLADPAQQGRMTGSPGAQRSAKWLSGYFAAEGLGPMGAGYPEPFQFNAGERLLPGENKLEIIRSEKLSPTEELAVDKDFRPLAFSENGTAEGDVVFAGYGLSVPEGGRRARFITRGRVST